MRIENIPRGQLPPTAEQDELLRAIAGRPWPGPLLRTANRDRLYRLGFIEVRRQVGATKGQANLYIVTETGLNYLKEHPNGPAIRPDLSNRNSEHPAAGR